LAQFPQQSLLLCGWDFKYGSRTHGQFPWVQFSGQKL
jgi:hypothetical protein